MVKKGLESLDGGSARVEVAEDRSRFRFGLVEESREAVHEIADHPFLPGAVPLAGQIRSFDSEPSMEVVKLLSLCGQRAQTRMRQDEIQGHHLRVECCRWAVSFDGGRRSLG